MGEMFMYTVQIYERNSFCCVQQLIQIVFDKLQNGKVANAVEANTVCFIVFYNQIIWFQLITEPHSLSVYLTVYPVSKGPCCKVGEQTSQSLTLLLVHLKLKLIHSENY